MSDSRLVRVRDVMKTEFDLIEGVATVADALRRMRYPDTGVFIVDRRSEDDEYGIVVLADIAKKVLAHDRSPQRVNIYEIMSKPAMSVSPDMDIRYCSRLFHRFGIARAPVCGGGKVVGVVSYTDMVVKGMLRQWLNPDLDGR